MLFMTLYHFKNYQFCVFIGRSVVKLQLAGNNVPGDVHTALDTAVCHNADRAQVTYVFTDFFV